MLHRFMFINHADLNGSVFCMYSTNPTEMVQSEDRVYDYFG